MVSRDALDNLSVSTIAENCEAAGDPEGITTSLETVAKAGFSKKIGPWAFLVARLSRAPKFAERFSTSFLKYPERYQSTLLPRIVAEALSKSGNGTLALRLWKTFGTLVTDPASEAAWSELALHNLRRQLQAGAVAEAEAFLNRDLSITGGLASEVSARAWYLFSTDEKVAKTPAYPVEAAAWLLNPLNRKTFPRFSPALVEQLCQHENWPVLWNALTTFPALCRPAETRALQCLFNATVESKTRPPASDLREEAQIMGAAATIALYQDLAAVAAWRRDSALPWAQDLSLLNSLARGPEKPSRDPVRAIQSLMNGLRRARLKIQKHAWSHEKFLQLGKLLLARYCTEARGTLRSLAGTSPDPDWQSAVAQVDRDFRHCEEAGVDR
jgi:hypothetical protein